MPDRYFHREESDGQDNLLKQSSDDFDYHFIGTRTKSAAINPVSTTILNMFKILRAFESVWILYSTCIIQNGNVLKVFCFDEALQCTYM